MALVVASNFQPFGGRRAPKVPGGLPPDSHRGLDSTCNIFPVYEIMISDINFVQHN